MKATRLLSETLLRAQERFEETLDQLDVAEANTMPAPYQSIANQNYPILRDGDFRNFIGYSLVKSFN